MYKHNKEGLFLEHSEMLAMSYFDPFFREGAMPEGVVKITKVPPLKVPTKYMLQLGGMGAIANKTLYQIDFTCRKERDSRF